MKETTGTSKKRSGRHIHLTGIKGVAMAALAVYLSEAGDIVTGSDVPEKFPTDEELRRTGITVYEGFDPGFIEESLPDAIYYTGAHGGSSNPEVTKAESLGIPALPHGKALGNIMEGSRQFVVSGSHGKTTTSAMLAVILTHAGLDPSYAIGCGAISGDLPAGHFGKPPFFVAEGDEYVTDPARDPTPRFHWMKPEVLVVTNIDFDHPDVYPDLKSVQRAFSVLARRSGQTVLNADDPNGRMLKDIGHVRTYGFSPASDVRIVRVSPGNGRMFFSLEERGVSIGDFAIRVPGSHNVLNATAAAVAASTAGVGWDTIKSGLLAFTGTRRRFEIIHENTGITVVDDYAHHPAEIKATLKAARDWYPGRRIVAVFQPHTYSRTQALMQEFSRAFADADEVVLAAIYASAREKDTHGIDGRTLLESTLKHHPRVQYAKDKAAVLRLLGNTVKAGDAIICMGAGDIYSWIPDIARHVSSFS